MTLITQLPAALSVGGGDLLPLAQSGQLYAVSVAQLTAGLQPALSVPSGELLGRQSLGAGAPENIIIGNGLALAGGVINANGADHAGYPVQAAMAVADELVVSNAGAPGLLPVAALRGLFSAGAGVSISTAGVIAVMASAVAGPVGPAGAAGAAGAVGPVGPAGPAGAGLQAPAAANAASSISAGDYVAVWQNGAVAWMPYGQFIGGQTINQLAAAAAPADSDLLLVAQGGTTLNAQSFGAVWNYLEAKLPAFRPAVVELTANTLLDGSAHNGRLLVASAPVTVSADFANMGPGFSCELVNLSAGVVSFGTGISAGSGATSLSPGASARLLGLQYSGGSLVWWSGVGLNIPLITMAPLVAPAVNAAFSVSGGIFNDAPLALDYSIDGGVSWLAAPNPVLTANAYSFTAPGLAAGTYALRVRDHANVAVLGVSNAFVVVPPSISINATPATVAVNMALTVGGSVSPAGSPVEVGFSASVSAAPTSWVNASITGQSWQASLTPAATGPVYVWAQQANISTVNAVTGLMNVVTPSLTISVTASGVAGVALTVSGTVSPAGDVVNLQLATQNTNAPTTGWVAASNNAGSFSTSLTPAAPGTYYAWAMDPVTGVSAVSAAIAVAAAAALAYTANNPGGSYTHGLGSIALNGNVAPAQAVPTQVALSTSNTVAPTSGWQVASNIYANTLWGIYYVTPAVAGNYYVWVETAAGAAQMVSSFTVSVV